MICCFAYTGILPHSSCSFQAYIKKVCYKLATFSSVLRLKCSNSSNHKTDLCMLLNVKSGFIMLENLAWDFVKPCIMDLKMGTQQFSEHEKEAKRMLKERRCAETTSASLGFRICGTQVIGHVTQLCD